ncbi:MAG TPA: glutamine synthetase [Thermoplasmata archaeon]|nr:glutamine synthetase [Thermoplasmata archaeon]
MWFVDLLGFPRRFTTMSGDLRAYLEDGVGFDGSSVPGYVAIEESDLVAMPDTSTFVVLPGDDDGGRTARVFCEVLDPDGSPFEGDPRHVLRRALDQLSKRGWTYYVGPEVEYFYLEDSRVPEITDRGGYFDAPPLDRGEALRRETVRMLEDIGIRAELAHHEVAFSQQEINMRYADALRMADNVMAYRHAVKEVARRHGIVATFMPKPVFGINGSGMHVHQSLFEGDANLFFDPDADDHLSRMARGFIAGLLKHAPEITAITNQWVNSYKRLVPGYEAPVYISWGRRNRSALVRVPMYQPGKERALRAEYRSPDPACNPYLAFSVMLAAGLSGIDGGYDLPDPQEDDIHHLSPSDREARGIGTLPSTLAEALDLMEGSDLVRRTLGDHIFERFIRSRREEWVTYHQHVSDWEIDRYLHVL